MWIRSFLVKDLAAAMQAEVRNVEIGWKQSVNIFLESKFEIPGKFCSVLT